jgi:hypothetical protein
MDMIDEELLRLHNRLDDLRLRVIPEFESKTELMFAQIMPMRRDSEERKILEAEYKILSRELSTRSDELIKIRQEIENLEMEKNLGNR